MVDEIRVIKDGSNQNQISVSVLQRLFFVNEEADAKARLLRDLGRRRQLRLWRGHVLVKRRDRGMYTCIGVMSSLRHDYTVTTAPILLLK